MRAYWPILILQTLLVAAALAGASKGWFPLGVPGEWEWGRITLSSMVGAWAFVAGIVLIAFSGLSALGARWLDGTPGRLRQTAALVVLVLGTFGAQLAVLASAPPGYGLAKWPNVLNSPASTGYHNIAAEIADIRQFLRDYPAWIRAQDSLHIGTHPPGLFLAAYASLEAMKAHPDLAWALARNAPASFEEGRATPPQMATYVATGLATLAACSLASALVFGLCRAYVPARDAWGAACLWSLAPAVLLFQPVADTWFPLLSASAFLLAERRGRISAALAGAILAVGMLLTLAFLAVGFVVGIQLLARGRTWRERAILLAATGIGFAGCSALFAWGMGTDILSTWWANQRNHARFYEEYPRSYWAWVLANPIELAFALGIPAAVLALVPAFRPRSIPTVAWATALALALLTLSGRNLSEVARLWLPFFPPLLTAAAMGLHLARFPAWAVGIAVGLTGVLTVALQAMIQVVYPI
jgi:hypothetical protein